MIVTLLVNIFLALLIISFSISLWVFFDMVFTFCVLIFDLARIILKFISGFISNKINCLKIKPTKE